MTLRGLFFCAGLLAASWGGAAPAVAKDWSQIRIAAEGSHPPFNYLDERGRLQGFEIDIARAACRKLNASCDFVTQDFEGLIPALIAGRYDAIFSSLSITEQRKAFIAFSSKYYETLSMFVAAKRDGKMSTEPEAMKGKTIGVKLGSTNARYLDARYAPAGAKIRPYLTADEARLDLAEGRIDAILADKTALLYWLEKSPLGRCCQMVGRDVSDPTYFGEGIGIGLRKSDPGLKAMFDKAIATLRADGTYEAIRTRYFPYDIY
ncbi:transporter substrate-binding domain-containing protein [Hansschlegelia zhihuaiae]|uniref:Transporter substrate-binding domain-containing protein n=1 Tax=Hansschlegelia zhihuaiae TaxID=405005 RepID=A0A4Q0MNC5_9HYPH|nr:transporter substrate-binding domain-containing protein [Hansschlegelia zhihuaiae]RXF75387.1 transporter substrate-binding domain-containing protein [Hansschlegelia zhihuaiae]